MVNKDLDEQRNVTVEMNKRMYHYITGLLAEKGLDSKIVMKILNERKEK